MAVDVCRSLPAGISIYFIDLDSNLGTKRSAHSHLLSIKKPKDLLPSKPQHIIPQIHITSSFPSPFLFVGTGNSSIILPTLRKAKR